LLQVQTGDGFTAFLLAAQFNHAETLKKIWVWAEEMQLNPIEQRNKLFLTTENCVAKIYGTEQH